MNQKSFRLQKLAAVNRSEVEVFKKKTGKMLARLVVTLSVLVGTVFGQHIFGKAIINQLPRTSGMMIF